MKRRKSGSGITVQGTILLVMFGCLATGIALLIYFNPEITRLLTTGW